MFRRKARSEPDRPDPDDDAPDVQGDDAEQSQVSGPWDSENAPGDDVQRADLGSLLVAPHEGAELRLQVDEATGVVQSVMLAADEGALELRAFAAPRNGDLWAEVRPQIA